jgi:ubiquitin C-terminal hydrolase
MNSCLQCISFTEELTEKLVTRDISRDILNKTDSREGVITFALSDLLKRLWRSGDEKCVSPFKFKKYFGDIHTMFQGKTQEDGH